MSRAPARDTGPLWPWSLFAAIIAAAGLPIYIHAPKVFADSYGISLAALGATLAALRLIDVVQDPLLGWLSESMRARRRLLAALGVGLTASAMIGLFAVAPPVAPLLWFAITLTGLFTGFSLLTILFYAQGVTRAADMGAGGHLRLAGWRETGTLLGVSIAAVAPVVLASFSAQPFAVFAFGYAALAVIAALAMRLEWRAGGAVVASLSSFAPVLRDALARRLLMIALLNASPVAVTSTLFLFFVESRLDAAGMEGGLLLLFFLSAAASALIWAKVAARIGEKQALMAGMGLAILAFLWAVTLGSGDVAAFAVICIASGAAMGADLTLLPAIFARRLGTLGQGEAAGFALWSFVSKLSLAIAAAVLLPGLQAAGFRSGAENSESALFALSLLYAALPCALKLLALLALATTDLKEV